jgi:hypothetical protein
VRRGNKSRDRPLRLQFLSLADSYARGKTYKPHAAKSGQDFKAGLSLMKAKGFWPVRRTPSCVTPTSFSESLPSRSLT